MPFLKAGTIKSSIISLLSKSVTAAGYKPGENVSYALDVAASEFYKDGIYTLKAEGRQLNNSEMIDYYNQISDKYPILSIEDGIDQDEWAAWTDMTKQLNDLQIVGDDLFVTNPNQNKHRVLSHQLPR